MEILNLKIQDSLDVQKLRKKEYDTNGEQLDRITKALAYLSKNGVDIGDAGREQVEHCNAVKNKFKKKG